PRRAIAAVNPLSGRGLVQVWQRYAFVLHGAQTRISAVHVVVFSSDAGRRLDGFQIGLKRGIQTVLIAADEQIGFHEFVAGLNQLTEFLGSPLNRRILRSVSLSFAKTHSPVVSTAWEMGGNVAELGYMRPRRGILESDDILPKYTEHRQAIIFQDSVLCL